MNNLTEKKAFRLTFVLLLLLGLTAAPPVAPIDVRAAVALAAPEELLVAAHRAGIPPVRLRVGGGAPLRVRGQRVARRHDPGSARAGSRTTHLRPQRSEPPAHRRPRRRTRGSSTPRAARPRAPRCSSSQSEGRARLSSRRGGARPSS